MIFLSCWQKPVKVQAAMTGTAIVTGVLVVASILTALGITAVVASPDFQDGCQQIANKLGDDLTDVVDKAKIQAAGMATVAVTPLLMLNTFHAACEAFPQGLMRFSTFEEMAKTYRMDTLSTDFKWKSTKYLDFTKISSFSGIQFLGRSNFSGINFDKRGKSVTLPFCNTDATTLGFSYHWIVDAPAWASSPEIWVNGSKALSFSYPVFPHSNCHFPYIYLFKITVVASSKYVLFTPYGNYWSVTAEDCTSSALPIPAPAQDLFIPAADKFIAQGKSVINTPAPDVIDNIRDKFVDKDGYIPLTVPRGRDIDSDTTKQRQRDVLGKDISTPSDRTKDDVSNKTRDVTDTDTGDPRNIPRTNPKKMKIPGNDMTKKFPFSIPWDLYRAISVLQSPGAAPKFTMHFGSATHVVDFAQFDPVAKVARWGLSLLFLLALIVLTNKVIKH